MVATPWKKTTGFVRVVDGTSRHILTPIGGTLPRICPHYVGLLPVLFKPQFHEHHKNSLKIEKNTLKLKPTLLCLAFRGLECHLLPPVDKANINTLPCLLFFMHSIFFTWQSGHLKGNYSSDLCPGEENCLSNTQLQHIHHFLLLLGPFTLDWVNLKWN